MKFKDFMEQMEIDYTSTDGKKPHKHTYRIDQRGDGRTLKTEGEGPDHIHEIKRGEVMDSGPDNHIHILREK